MPSTTHSPRTSWLTVMAATLVGFGLLFAPREQVGRIESLVHDAALPGLQLLDRSQQWAMTLPETFEQWKATAAADSEPDEEDPTPALQEQLTALQQQVRRLQSQNAQLQTELDEARAATASPFVAESAAPLFVPELLDARIVAVDDVSVAIQRASAQRVVDIGQTAGVVPADFVVSAEQTPQEPARLLIDQGDDADLHPDQPVFAGRCVVGKIQQVGRWTSSVLPVTDLEFRGRAQLMRRTGDGLVVGPEGIIAGDGKEGCKLNFIAATQPVSVGDEVYTAVAGTPLPMPMYYGRVVAVSLAEGAPYWKIDVKPAETMVHARTVQVLRVVLNPARTATTSTDKERL
jgi:rod shape-determining protein MreC